MRIGVALRAFWAALFQADVADQIDKLLAGDDSAVKRIEHKPVESPKPPAPKKSLRSDAVALLAALQREARFVDLVQESLDQYDDQQVGAAARDVLRDCRAVLDRLFGLQHVVDSDEGQTIELPAGFDTGRFRLTGNVAGQPPFQGRLVHHGWEAVKCDLPEWSGSEAAARVVAAAEVELGGQQGTVS